MSLETHVDRAIDRSTAEREAIEAKRNAYDRFLDRISDVRAESVAASAPGSKTTLGARFSSSDGARRTVRRAFAETVRPHSVDDVDAEGESLLVTVRHELGESVALALAPTTDTPFSPQVRSAVVDAVEDRQTETKVLARALEREAVHLREVKATVEEATDWVAAADETPLSNLGFDELADRHETLATHRERCAERIRERQSFLNDTTGSAADVAVRHHSVVGYLYQESPTDYPALDVLVRLENLCATCQEAVRDHLVRRA